jgi:hypothetical protein
MLALLACPAFAQQVADTTYRFPNSTPAYPPATGPTVCVDAAHENFHTSAGRYRPFAILLEQDGYVVRPWRAAFDSAALRDCGILVIANARAAGQGTGYPNLSAFRQPELDSLFAWLRAGGSLLLIADHPPFAGAAAGLASLLGFQSFDGYAGPSATSPNGVMVFGALDEAALRRSNEQSGIPHEQFRGMIGEPARLADHPITRGRSAGEAVGTVVTFTGHAFHPARDVQPLLVLGPAATGVVVIGGNARNAPAEEYPLFPLGGWLQGGTRRIGAGRVVMLGEAAMCTAQLAGAQAVPMGMNMPFAARNGQFCLNVLHWLSGLLDGLPEGNGP